MIFFTGKIPVPVVGLALVLSITGCASVNRSPATARHGQSIVVVRMLLDDHGSEKVLSDFKAVFWRLNRDDGSMDPAPSRERAAWQTLGTIGHAGWKYTVLAPGDYCVDISTRLGSPDGHSRYRVSIPDNKQLLWAGTIRVHVTKSGHGGLVLEDVAPDPAEARTIIAQKFPNFAGSETDLMTSYESLAGASADFQQRGIIVTNLGLAAIPALDGCSTRQAEIAGAVFVVPGGTLLLADAYLETGVLSVIGLAVAAGSLPAYGITYGITRGTHEIQWSPYEKQFRAQAKAFRVDQRLAEAVASRLAESFPAGTETNHPSPLVLQIQPYQVCLRGDKQQRFAIEVGVAARLVDSMTGRDIWQNRLMYRRKFSSSQRSVLYKSDRLAPCETIVASPPVSHRLEEYHGKAGEQIIEGELHAAVGEMSTAIVRSLSAPAAGPGR